VSAAVALSMCAALRDSILLWFAFLTEREMIVKMNQELVLCRHYATCNEVLLCVVVTKSSKVL
jgi:hypothetical protein